MRETASPQLYQTFARLRAHRPREDGISRPDGSNPETASFLRVADLPPLVPVDTKALLGSNGGCFRYEEGVFVWRRDRYACVRPLSGGKAIRRRSEPCSA